MRLFSFSTIYIHIDFAFKTSTACIIVNAYDAYWAKERRGGLYRTYDKVNIKEAMRYLIGNAYFQVGSLLFQQIIGIPMGSDPAPFLANLFLFIYESRWLTNLKISDPRRARRLSNIFRFIDDLIALNDGHEFLKSFKDIYPVEMVLKQENDTDQSASFLDLEINIDDKSFTSKLYDKRDSFNFSIVRFPHKCSNMPSKMFYSTIGAEILRIARATSKYAWFCRSVNCFIERMKKQGTNVAGLRRTLSRLMQRHHCTFTKYLKLPTEIIDDILNI